MPAVYIDVTGQAAQMQRQSLPNRQQQPQHYQNHTDYDEYTSQVHVKTTNYQPLLWRTL